MDLVQSSRILIALFPSSFSLPSSFSSSFASFLSPSSSVFFLSATWLSAVSPLAVSWMTLLGLPGHHGRGNMSVRCGAAPSVLAHAGSEPSAPVSPPDCGIPSVDGKEERGFWASRFPVH